MLQDLVNGDMIIVKEFIGSRISRSVVGIEFGGRGSEGSIRWGKVYGTGSVKIRTSSKGIINRSG